MKTNLTLTWSAGLYAAGVAVTAWAAPLKIELPPESVTFKNAPGAEIAAGQCLTCHSAEYVTTQPPLARAAWKASVEKMQLKYGAPVLAEQVETLVDYLAKSYGAEQAAPGK
jgi:sulfite dehydrogenase